MRFATIAVLTLTAILTGCAGRAELIPNGDPSLRKTAAEFAADAAKRYPYKANAPAGGDANASAEVGYVFDRIDVLNTAGADVKNIEMWVNSSYVVFLPSLPSKKIVSVPFQAIYNDAGQSFPTSNGKFFSREPILVKKVEFYRDGKMYNVPLVQGN
jgi:hypothetical protein